MTDTQDIPVPKKLKKNAVTIGGKIVYLNNKELLEEIKIAREKGEMTNKLAIMLQLLCARYARKGNWVNYSYNLDMQSYAMLMLVKTWKGFDPARGSNPFAFFTQCIKNSFRQYLNHERKHRDIRDIELVNQGLNPSYSYSFGARDANLFEDEQDFHSTYNPSRDDVSPMDLMDVEDENGPVITIDPADAAVSEANTVVDPDADLEV